MTDESTVLDPTPDSAAAAVIGASVVAKLRADMKPRKAWKKTKADFERVIADREIAIESLNECLKDEKARASLNFRIGILGWSVAAAAIVYGAWVTAL